MALQGLAVALSPHAPARKVRAGGLGGAVATLTVWALSQFTGFKPDPGIVAALTTVITFAVAYFAPQSGGDAALE
jgi:lipopolysaccharide export LptBFGC system permease protein LptF